MSGAGGRVMVLDAFNTSATDAIIAQSVDYGFGGLALALDDLDGDGDDEILFAPYYESINSSGDPARARLIVLELDATGTQLVERTTAALGGSTYNADFPGYGAGGIAVGTCNGVPLIVVTTLNGEIAALAWDNSGGGSLQPASYGLVEGGLGAYNSILIGNLDGQAGDEVYVAGTLGIRKFNITCPQ